VTTTVSKALIYVIATPHPTVSKALTYVIGTPTFAIEKANQYVVVGESAGFYARKVNQYIVVGPPTADGGGRRRRIVNITF